MALMSVNFDEKITTVHTHAHKSEYNKQDLAQMTIAETVMAA